LAAETRPAETVAGRSKETNHNGFPFRACGTFGSFSETKFNEGRKALDEQEELSKEEVGILDLLARGLSREFRIRSG
jgi:hypothetical protein